MMGETMSFVYDCLRKCKTQIDTGYPVKVRLAVNTFYALASDKYAQFALDPVKRTIFNVPYVVFEPLPEDTHIEVVLCFSNE